MRSVEDFLAVLAYHPEGCRMARLSTSSEQVRRAGAFQTCRRIARLLLPVVVAVLLSSSTARSATLRVPEEYPDITSAANVAQRGDSILVWRNPNGADYENQQINLRQGVVLRGMEQIYPFTEMSIRGCLINLQEELPSTNDTTRVEHFAIYNPPYQEAIHVYTPRSSIVQCRIWTSGPQDYTAVRVWNGGVIARNFFGGTVEANTVEIRQGVAIVAENVFESVFLGLQLFNQGAPASASLLFKNNTLVVSGLGITLRSDSDAEIVNSIFHDCGGFQCTGNVDIHHNDLYLTNPQCTLGEGNISANPLFCTETTYWLDPASPCIGSGENGAIMGAGGICGVTGVGGQASPANRLRLTVDPNPVSSGAEFGFDGGIGNPTLEIFDPQGRLVDLLRPRGQRVRWNPGGSLPRGVYFARLRGAGVSETVKFLVIR